MFLSTDYKYVFKPQYYYKLIVTYITIFCYIVGVLFIECLKVIGVMIITNKKPHSSGLISFYILFNCFIVWIKIIIYSTLFWLVSISVSLLISVLPFERLFSVCENLFSFLKNYFSDFSILITAATNSHHLRDCFFLSFWF